MRTKDQGTIAKIDKFVCDFSDKYGYSPSLQEIANAVGIAKATAFRYVNKMCEDGILDQAGSRSLTSPKVKTASVRVPILGTIACGIPKFAEENIEEYVKLPVSLFGQGHFFILRAYGDSMIGAGINDGDLVVIRAQDYASPGQIVVALMEDEATLKRFYPEPEKHRIRLHPENEEMEDIYVEGCIIQGIAVKVLKDLE